MAAFLGVILLVGQGCMTLKEVPRSEFASKPERENVRIETTEGLVYEFDFAQVKNDTLTGYRRNSSGSYDEMNALDLPLDSVRALSVRGIDWYRTGFVGGGVLAAVVAAGLSAAHGSDDSGSNTSGGGKGGTPGSN